MNVQPSRPLQGQTSGFAVTGFILSLVGLFLCGIPSLIGAVLGGIGIVQARGGMGGYGMSVAAIVIAVPAILGWLLLAVLWFMTPSA